MALYHLKPIKQKEPLPDGVALKCFVETGGDPVGVVYVDEPGGFVLWREGACIGTFDTLKSLYRKLDELDV